MEVREDQPLVPDEDVRVAESPDRVDEIERPGDQEQDPDEGSSAATPHLFPFHDLTSLSD
jgi:hypothetical protein